MIFPQCKFFDIHKKAAGLGITPDEYIAYQKFKLNRCGTPEGRRLRRMLKTAYQVWKNTWDLITGIRYVIIGSFTGLQVSRYDNALMQAAGGGA